MDKGEIRKLAGGASITFVGGIIGAGFTYITGIGISHLVGSEIVGVYYLSLIWVQLLSALSRFGFSDALLRFVPPEVVGGRNEARTRIVKTILVIGGLISVMLGLVLFYLVPLLGGLLGGEPVLFSYLKWFLAFMPLHVFFVLLMMVVQAHQRMRQVVLVRDILQPVSMFVLTLTLLLASSGDQFALIAGYVGSLLLGILAISKEIRRLLPGLMRVRGWMPLGVLLPFSVVAMGADVSHFLYRWMDTILISGYLQLDEVGIYSAAIRTSLLILLIPMAINAIYATMASGFYHNNETVKFETALQLSMRWCLILGMSIVLVFVVCAREILYFWGPEYGRGSMTLVILAAAQLPAVPGGVLAYTLVMCNRQSVEFLNTLILLVAIVALNIVLIPRFGLEGAATALLVTNTVGMILRWWQVRRSMNIQPMRWAIFRPIFAAIGAGIAGILFIGFLKSSVFVDPVSLFQNTVVLVVAGLGVTGIYLVLYLLAGYEEADRAFLDILLQKK